MPASSIQSSFGPATASMVQRLSVEIGGLAASLTRRPGLPSASATGTTWPALIAWPSMPPTPALWKVEREPSQGVSMPPAIAM